MLDGLDLSNRASSVDRIHTPGCPSFFRSKLGSSSRGLASLSAVVPYNPTMPIPIALYVPNVLGYTRMILAFLGLAFVDQPWTALSLWIAAALLDLVDGPLARLLSQTSQFGILLDVVADNVLRTCVWIAAASLDRSMGPLAAGCVCLEWTTMIATQLHAQGGEHWKQARTQDPVWIQSFFASNFRNPLGIWGLLGLFGANMVAYGRSFPEVEMRVPHLDVLWYFFLSGRLLSMIIELWFCVGYASHVLQQDAQAKRKDADTKKKD